MSNTQKLYTYSCNNLVASQRMYKYPVNYFFFASALTKNGNYKIVREQYIKLPRSKKVINVR